MDGIHAEFVEEQRISLRKPDRRGATLFNEKVVGSFRGVEPVIQKFDRIITVA
jgi:hypothetical protein